MNEKPIFKRFVAFASCMVLSVSSLLPNAALTAKLGATGAVAVATTLVMPSVAHAQKGKRICSYEARHTGIVLGLGMELYKWDYFTCTGYFAASVLAWGPMNIQAAVQGMLGGVVQGAANKARTKGFRFRYMQTCEDFTREALSGHWGGNVCHSMEDYSLYLFGNSWYGAAIKKV